MRGSLPASPSCRIFASLLALQRFSEELADERVKLLGLLSEDQMTCATNDHPTRAGNPRGQEPRMGVDVRDVILTTTIRLGTVRDGSDARAFRSRHCTKRCEFW